MVRSLSPNVPRLSLDAKRIAGTSLALSLHIVVFGVLLMPTRWSPPEKVHEPMRVAPIFLPPREVEPTTAPPRPTPRVEPRPQQPVETRPVTPTQPVDTAPVFEQGEIEAPPAAEALPTATSFDPGPPSLETLAYDIAPAPRYPRPALVRSLEGTVTLRVLVDETGKVLEARIERSSGHRLLDQAARDQVLERWRFHPAQRGGRAVAAYALVPIEFKLP